MNSGIKIIGCVIPKVFQYVMWLGLVLKTIGIEMHREHFKEGNIPVCWIDASTAFQNSGTKFL